jgi:PAS domain S-box-containing protein
MPGGGTSVPPKHILLEWGEGLMERDITTDPDSLQANSERLRFAPETGKPGSWQLDLATGTSDFTAACKADFGVLPDAALTYDRLFDLIHPDDRQRVRQAVQRAIDTQTGYDAEFRAVWPIDGSTHWINARGGIIPGPQGEAVRMVGVTLDITERKRAEVALNISEARYRRLFESAKDGILILDAETARITDANPFIAELLDYSHEELMGKELWQIGVFEDVEASKAAARELQEKRYIRYEDLPLETKAGRRINVQFVSNVYSEGDRPVIQCNIRDISDRKQAEARLREEERRFRTLVEQVRDYAIFMTDTQGRATSWNEGVRRVLGFGEGEWIGRDIVPLIFTPEDVQDGVGQRDFDHATATGTAGDDRWVMKKDGTRFFALGIVTALRDDAGSLLGFTKVMRDQTERKKIEDRLRQVAADLSEADRRKDEFLAMLAHELRNPLAPIRNGLQILRLTKGNTDGAAEQALEIMEEQTHHLTRLVEDLLDVSRITRGKIELRKEPVDLAVAMGHAAESVRPLAEARRHDFTVLPPPGPVMLAADPTRLEQVLVNLLNNAVKYTKPGGHISLTAGREGEGVVIRVRDTGVGISADLLPHIFDLFTQAQRTLDRSEGGLGIGLTMVNRLVGLHGGSVEAYSTGPDQGSEFVVRLPALPAPPQGAGPAAPTEQVSGGGRRILIVEDVVQVAQMLGMLLQVWGYDSRVAHDGPTGLVAFRTYQPDVVLCDIGLPGMSGYDVAGMMREEPRQTRPLLVAVTGYGGEEDRRRSHEAGFDFHMTKPVDPAALEKLLAGYTQMAPASY